MTKKFVVIFDWGYESSYHEFDTLEEAIKDRQNYDSPQKYPIYQLIEETYQLIEETIEYTLPDGTIHRENELTP